jgi:uncharacterized membrane protein YozB (DUF420 family)
MMSATTPASRRRGSALYLVLPFLMIAMAIIGFWPQYYGRLVSGSPLEGVSLHPLVHLHSTLFLVWLGIILGQAMLVRAGHTRVHRKIGPWLAGIGYLAAVVGVIGGLALAGARVTRGGPVDEAATFVAAPLLDMIMFTGFLTASLVYRRRPEVHKRLILFTGYSFAFIGLVRYLVRIPGMVDNLWLTTLLLMVPIMLCIAWEWTTRRRVHLAWWIGLAAFFTRLMLELLTTLPWWQPFGRALIAPFT